MSETRNLILLQATGMLFVFQDLWKKDPNTFPDPVVNGMLEFEWDLFIDAKRKVFFFLSLNLVQISFVHVCSTM